MKRGFYQRFWDFNDSITNPTPGQCFMCKSETHRVDICYEGFLHRHCVHLADQGANKNV